MADDDDERGGRNRFPISPRDAHLYASDEEDEKALKQLLAISPETLKFLTSLRPDEVETMRTLSQLDKEEREVFFQSLKLTKSVRTTGWFVRWLFLGLVGTFVAFNLMADQVMKLVHLFQNGAPK
ncbi:hypothetical protein [Aureimonas psammosilenae]|uniref:hypothetical protein n=1 Tax=Aureimonas psammosilenae TaxID=2495496 RepID=UPI00126074AE|nr:hypothetical protein [Aureimonas psammosilenae]